VSDTSDRVQPDGIKSVDYLDFVRGHLLTGCTVGSSIKISNQSRKYGGEPHYVLSWVSDRSESPDTESRELETVTPYQYPIVAMTGAERRCICGVGKMDGREYVWC